MKIIYSVGVKVPGGGIGNLSFQALQALIKSSFLQKAIVGSLSFLPKEGVVEFPWINSVPSFYWKDLIFDFFAKGQIERCDFFHGWNNMSLRSLRKARILGAITIVERASSHILTQKKLLQEEYRRFGVNLDPIDPRIVGRSLREYEECDFIFVPSQFAYESFLENKVPEKKLKLIPFGVDLEKFNLPKKPHCLFRVVFVGQVGLRKGVGYLLEAWSELSLKKAELVIVGPIFPDFKGQIQKFRNLPGVRYITYLSKTGELYQESDVFIFPTIEEGTALAVLEAMASSLPVITTPNAGSPLKNGKDGLIVPIRDVKSLKEAINDLYQDRNLAFRMGSEARRTVADLGWEKYQLRLIKTYQEIKA